MKSHKKAPKRLHFKAKRTKRAPKRHLSVRKAKKVIQKRHIRKINAKRHVKKIKAERVAKRLAIPKVKEKRVKIVQDFRAMNVADEALINAVIEDAHFTNHVSRSVGKRAKEIIKLLATPQTDDAIAEKLDIKINEVRRMLNTLNTFGVTRYNVNKDSKGWLTFKWYIDSNKLTEMKNEIITKDGTSGYMIPEGCNDFFICPKHYEEQKTIFPFETAFEMNFKCECGNSMKQVNKLEVEQLVMQEGKIL